MTRNRKQTENFRQWREDARKAASTDDAVNESGVIAPGTTIRDSARVLFRLAQHFANQYPDRHGCASHRAKDAVREANIFREWREFGGHVRGATECDEEGEGANVGGFGMAIEAQVAVGLGLDSGDPDTGLVRLLIIPDDSADLDNLLGDGMTEEQRKEEIRRIDREGVYGIVPQYRTSTEDPWQRLDLPAECWGFIGDDWVGQAEDFMSSALDEIKDAIKERAAERKVENSKADAVYVLRDLASQVNEDGALTVTGDVSGILLHFAQKARKIIDCIDSKD